ncbi:MAG: hypothetical protein M3Y08_03530 [Fibrobacterota bacterium]|nr:hypothetical protein [Fibrobacterota bacterium]
MKLNEFEDKLATVSDAKLRQMLASSRANGPEVAVTLILAECNRRGMDGLEDSGAPEGFPASATVAYPHENAGHAGADAPAPGTLADGIPAEGEPSEAPATAPDWLNEETKTGLPMFVKILILLITIGAVLGLAWKLTR